MRALICREFGPWEQLSLGTLDDPTPGEGEILIDVRAAGVNFPDLLIVQGKYQVLPPLPFVPGAEGAGVVSEVGQGVTRFEIGDPVVAVGTGLIGSFAEKMVVAESAAMPLAGQK